MEDQIHISLTDPNGTVDSTLNAETTQEKKSSQNQKNTSNDKPIRRKFNHPKELWSEHIVSAQNGNEASIEWLLTQVVRIYRRLRNDDDIVQELIQHFFSRVLPKLDPKYMPIPIIYKAAKRILINIHKRTIRAELKAKDNLEYFTHELESSMREVHMSKDKIDELRKAPELIRVIACCVFSPDIIRMINPSITTCTVNKMISEYTEERYGVSQSFGTLSKYW